MEVKLDLIKTLKIPCDLLIDLDTLFVIVRPSQAAWIIFKELRRVELSLFEQLPSKLLCHDNPGLIQRQVLGMSN